MKRTHPFGADLSDLPFTPNRAVHPATDEEVEFLDEVAGDLEIKVGQELSWVEVFVAGHPTWVPMMVERFEKGAVVVLGFFDYFYMSAQYDEADKCVAWTMPQAIACRDAILAKDRVTPSFLESLGLKYDQSSGLPGPDAPVD